MSRMDPHSVTDLEQGIVTRLDLDLDVDFSSRRLKGRAALALKDAQGGVLDLDTRDLEILAVTGDGDAALEYELGERDPVLGSRLRIQLPAGSASVAVEYLTSPDASALQWLAPEHTAGGTHPYLFSQCQPHHARSMVPIQDSAAVRVPYTARVTVPEPLVAVMSSAPGEKVSSSSGRSVWKLEMPQPLPPYLLALAVGNLASKDLGPRTRVYAEPETLDAAAWEFEGAEAMLEKAEKLFGPYRWERYDFLVMPPAFPYGGMENPRLTFLTPTLMAGDRSLVAVLAHELAHSWTGNLVTNATMNDFWLNEGFTVWAERRILEALEGPEGLALHAALGRQGLQEDMDNFGADSPYTKLRNDLEGVDPDDVYSRVPYEKGFLFVALLEQTVGRERFDAFILAYMDRFQFQSITTERFLAFLEEQMPGVAEQVGAKEWIYEPGIPANSPVFDSPRLKELTALAEGFATGQRPDPEEAKRWPVDEWRVYLGALPKTLSQEDCDWLQASFGLNESHNAEILCDWLVRAAASAYEPAYPKIREFLGSVGRMKFLKPLFKALHEGESTKGLAKEIFAANASHYHPIARGGLENILSS